MTVNTNISNSNGGSTASNLLEDPIDYSPLQAWVAQQETNPKPLTPSQRRALSDLMLSLRAEEPEVGDRDWISLLQRYLDASKKEGASASYREEAAPNNKWSYKCIFKLAEDIEAVTFPNEDAGFVFVDGTPSMPSFARKKDAKKYAAKCCVGWLMAKELMPSDGENVAFPKNGRKVPLATSSSSHVSAAAGVAGRSNDSGDGADDNIRLTQQVIELCRRLSIAPPRYEIKPCDETPTDGFFTGYADFGADSVKVPDNLGRVRAYTEKKTREKIAQEVLNCLIQEDRERTEQMEALLNMKLRAAANG